MTTLTPAVARGWRAGFDNLLDRELGTWWRTRRWLVHLFVWTGVTCFASLGTWLKMRSMLDPIHAVTQSTIIFFQFGGFFALIGAVLATQSALVGERNNGTAAWVLTKPATRKAFVLAKFAGIAFSFLVLSLVVPSLLLQIQLRLQWHAAPSPLHFAAGAGILALHQVFYIALAIMLGTLFSHRSAVAGVALGLWFAGGIFPPLLPDWVPSVMPWTLASCASSIAVQESPALTLWHPLLATTLWTVLFLAVALWRFEREEF